MEIQLKIRQYTAATMQEAILKIKVDLGPNAVILHTRKFKKGGFLGLFAREMIEVLAAIDPGEGNRTSEKGAVGDKQGEPSAPRGGGTYPGQATSATTMREREAEHAASSARNAWDREAEQVSAMADALVKAGRTAVAEGRALARSGAGVLQPGAGEVELGPHAANTRLGTYTQEQRPAPVVENELPVASTPTVTMMPESTMLFEEVSDLKSTVSDLKAMLAVVVGKLDVQPRSVAQFPTLLQKVYDRLLACDVDPSIARGLAVYLQKEQQHLTTFEDMADALEQPIAGLVNVAGPLKTAAGTCQIVALIGPTGVGKTTTIAKLAANFTLSRQVDMALLTIDTYRVAAIEQLKTYGDIIGLPVEVVLTPQTLKEALKRHQAKDMVLIDTAGRSPYNRMHINELRSFLDVDTACETHLVLSSSTRLADLKQIVKNFATTGVDRLLFSKTDETDIVGGVISIAHETGLPVSYITTGQSVPDDILVADAANLARMLVQQLKA